MSANLTSVGKLLSSLSGANSEVALGFAVAGAVIPVVKGIISAVKHNPDGTAEYTVIVANTEATLDKVIGEAEADIDQVNVELARLGLPPLAKP